VVIGLGLLADVAAAPAQVVGTSGGTGASPGVAVEPSGSVLVTVAPGETVWDVARRVAPGASGESVAALAERIATGNALTSVRPAPGQVLRVTAG
jgi:Tfp pilus assembly protein FimV